MGADASFLMQRASQRDWHDLDTGVGCCGMHAIYQYIPALGGPFCVPPLLMKGGRCVRLVLDTGCWLVPPAARHMEYIMTAVSPISRPLLPGASFLPDVWPDSSSLQLLEV